MHVSECLLCHKLLVVSANNSKLSVVYDIMQKSLNRLLLSNGQRIQFI